MAPSESIILRAKAKQLNVPNYKQLSMDELRAAVADADGGKPAEASDNGAQSTKTSKRKSAPKKGVASKRKAAAKSAPAKSTKRKPAQRKTAAAKGKAKRQTTGKAKPARKTSGAKRGKVTTAKRQTVRKASKPKRTPRINTKRGHVTNPDAGRQMIDASGIDWQAESSVGNDPQSNRGIIMKLLRKHKGNIDKVWEALADKAKSMYPKTEDGRARSKDAAQTLLRWHIGRTRFDFVKSSGQHPEADNPAYAKAARKRFGKAAPRKAAGASRKSAGAKRGPRPAGRKTAAQKPARGRPKASAAGRGNPRSASGRSAKARKRGK